MDGGPNPLIHLAGPLYCPDLGLDDAVAAELAPRTGHDAALERPRLRGVPRQKRLGQKVIEAVLGDASNDQVLVRSETDSIAVRPCESAHLLELLTTHPPNRHVETNISVVGAGFKPPPPT